MEFAARGAKAGSDTKPGTSGSTKSGPVAGVSLSCLDIIGAGDSRGLQALLRQEGDACVVGVAATGSTALITAMKAKTTPRTAHVVADMVKVLLAAGCNPNLADASGNRPLLQACQSARNSWASDVIIALLKAGANPNDTDVNGNTPLHLLCRTYTPTSPSWRQLVKAFGALISAGDGSALHVANSSGATPLHVAAGAMARLSLHGRSREWEYVGRAQWLSSHGRGGAGLPPVVMLCDAGANVNAFDGDGCTPLLACVKHLSPISNGSSAIVALAECGAALNVCDSLGKRALELVGDPRASQFRQGSGTLEVLLRVGCDPNHLDELHPYTPFAGICGCALVKDRGGRGSRVEVTGNVVPSADVIRMFLRAGGDVLLSRGSGMSVAELCRGWTRSTGTAARKLVEFMARAQHAIQPELALLAQEVATPKASLPDPTQAFAVALGALGAAFGKRDLLASLARVGGVVSAMAAVSQDQVQALISTAMRQRLDQPAEWDADVAVRFGACVRSARDRVKYTPAPYTPPPLTFGAPPNAYDNGTSTGGGQTGGGAGGSGAGAILARRHVSHDKSAAPENAYRESLSGKGSGNNTHGASKTATPGDGGAPNSMEGWLIKRGAVRKVCGGCHTRPWNCH